MDCETKLFPRTLSVNAPLPVETPEGDNDVIWGIGLATGVIVKVSGWVVPPPGEGVVTVTCAVPEFWMSPARICAVNCVELTKIVLRLLPFQETIEAGVRLEPSTVRMNAGWPASMLSGDKDLILGAG